MKALIIYKQDYSQCFNDIVEIVKKYEDKIHEQEKLAAVINPERKELIVCEQRRETWKEIGVYNCHISIVKRESKKTLSIKADFADIKMSLNLNINMK